jgi:hypothetical protein
MRALRQTFPALMYHVFYFDMAGHGIPIPPFLFSRVAWFFEIIFWTKSSGERRKICLLTVRRAPLHKSSIPIFSQ